jgi:hypothetical protein
MKIRTIIRHIRDYEKTGRISNSLVPFFNQNGKWCEKLLPQLSGKGPRVRHEIPHAMMRKITLPKERRITGNMARPVLRTSFVVKNDDKVVIPYAEIRGSVMLNGNAIIEANSLRRVGGNFSTDTSKAVQALNLCTVGGDLDVSNSSMLVATSLRDVGGSVYLLGSVPPNLVTIGGCCVIQKAVCMNDNELRYVEESLTLVDLDKIYLPKLEYVGGHMVMPTATRIEARKLYEVGGSLIAGRATVILMPNLRFVYGDLNSQNAKEFYPLDLEVSGSWFLYHEAYKIWKWRMKALAVLKGKKGVMYF